MSSSNPFTGYSSVPSAPQNISVVAGDHSVIIDWEAPSSDGGLAITSYTVTSTPGNFTSTVSNLTATVSGLTAGTSYTFDIYATNAVGNGPSATSKSIKPLPLIPNAVSSLQNDTSASLIRKLFSESMGGKNWDALIAALGHSDDVNLANAELTYNQLFKSTASGFYLDRLCADFGIIRPKDVNISDQQFSKLAIKVSNNKLTIQSILDILELFYGSEATRAHVISGIVNNTPTSPSPYNLKDGDNLILNIDNQNYNIIFSSINFQNINQATASEIANSINIQLNNNSSTAYAVSKFNPAINGDFLYIYSGALGVFGSVQVLGGSAQNALQFGNNLNIDANGVNWSIEIYPSSSGPGKVRFTPDILDISSLTIGDYITVYGSEFNSANIGTFSITNKDVSWFEVDNFSGVAQNVTQTSTSDLIFYRPVRYTTQSRANSALAVQSKKDSLDIIVPVTSTITSRNLKTAAYLQSTTTINIINLSRDSSGIVTATTDTISNLSVGQMILVEGATGCKLNGLHSISSIIDSTHFQYITSEAKIAQNIAQTECSVTPVKASKGVYNGPYVFDRDSGIAITSISTTLTQTLSKDSSYRQITVSDSSKFPDGIGYLVFGFGTDFETTSVRYIARPSNGTLLLDSTFVLPNTIPSGSDITLLAQKGAYTPPNINELGTFYVTGSSAGRTEALYNINAVAAGTISINETIVYPSDRGLGGENSPVEGISKLSDLVYVYAGDNVDQDIEAARED